MLRKMEGHTIKFMRENGKAYKGMTRYLFATPLRHNKAMYFEFKTDMRQETLIRCLLRCFEHTGEVIWACLFGNMKTIMLGKDERIWNEAFRKFSNELEFHGELCGKDTGDQKCSAKNSVRYVGDNFISEIEFLDDKNIDRRCQEWLVRINGTINQAHREIPFNVLQREQEKFIPLLTTMRDYGLFTHCKVNRESVVYCEGSAYSVPINQFISHFCYCRWVVEAFGSDILKMYELFMRCGKDDFMDAVAIVLKWDSYGAEYLLKIPMKSRKNVQLPLLPGIPLKKDMDRNLASHIFYPERG